MGQDDEKATFHLKAAIQNDPNSPVYPYYLAIHCRVHDNLFVARSCCEEALRLDPNHYLSRCLLVDIFLSERNFIQAKAHLDELEDGPYELYHSRMGEYYRLKNDQEIAQMYFKIVLESGVNDVYCLARLGYIRKSEEQLQRALEVDPNLGFAHSAMGELLASRGMLLEADQYFTRALELDSRDAVALKGRGTSLYAAKKYNEALEVFESLLELDDTHDASVHVIMGDLYLRKRDAVHAKMRLKNALDLDPKSSIAHAKLGALYHTQGKRVEAERFLKRALKLDPSNEFAKYELNRRGGLVSRIKSLFCCLFNT
jgi:Tfp pilus assembly protein PilF